MSWHRSIVAIVALSLAGGVCDAQTERKVYRVGLLSVGVSNTGILGPGVVQDFARRGYRLDTNLVFESRAAEGRLDRLPGFVSELVASHVDAIITQGFMAAVAAEQGAPGTPIIVAGAGDPVAASLVASLSRPGGNMTGISELATELSAKRLELLKEAVPAVHSVAVLWNMDDRAMTLRYQAAQVEGAKLGLTIVPLGVRAPDDFEAAFAAMTRNPPDAILMVTDVLTNLNRKRVIEFAAQHSIPAIYEYDWNAREGGLMAYGPDMDAVYDSVVGLTDRILKGSKPAELPLELPSRLRLSINLKTAKALGLEFPETILVRADDVIE